MNEAADQLTADERNRLIEAARAVLEGNRAGDSTKPSLDLYPHQWMWDSCFIAIGVSNYDPERAQNEIRALLRGQWSNGMVPQIIFNPESTGYFPGPDVWQSEHSPFAPADVATSGITQPPILATAVLAAFRRDPYRDRAQAFGAEVYPKIRAYHDFLYRERNPDGTGLIVVVHPWESGLDNSPPYLDAGSRVHLTYQPKYTRLDTLHVAAANRPTNKDYDLFIWLLEQMRRINYDWGKYLPDAPMQVEDVLFNSILCQANEDLVQLGQETGVIRDWDEDEIFIDYRRGTRQAIESKLWDEETGLYYSFDRVEGILLKDATVASLGPLMMKESPVGAGADGAHEHTDNLRRALASPGGRFASTAYACPTTAPDSKWFNPENYWLGPVWLNTNWLLLHGDKLSKDEKKRLRDDVLKLIQKSGFREYFNPLTGEGYGTNSFSWSAALTIDLLTSEA